MTATVDKKIVEMSFENDKFENGVHTSLGTIDKLKKSLNFENAAKSFDGISAAANRVNLGSIADGVQGISNHFSAMGILAITTLVNIANSAYQAGISIIKALTIDPIKTGLEEYELKLNSVQTILANTSKEGTNLKQVTDALNELNAYSDKTIYNFGQMARNVGTFTAAGIKLDTSVAAIKGIANLAAISGSNAEQASSAMYQLSQALATGTVRLMDWNSVSTAGLGGKIFQDSLVETARVHGIAIDQMLEQEGGFRNSLQKGWLTSEILTETLAKFTGDLNEDQLRTMGYTEDQVASIIKMGQTATDAAQKVKTFSQLFGTLKETAQSGWAQTWEVIIGNFDEAREFMTQLNNQFGAILNSSANARNAMITGWKDLGGRTKLIEAFQNALNAVLGIVNPLKSAFRDIFPATTAQQLFNITDGLAKFAKSLILGSETTDKVRRIFKGLFALLDIGRMAISALLKALFGLIGSFSDTGEGLLDLTAKFGDWLVKLRESLIKSETFTTIFSNIAKVIKITIEGVIGFFSALIGGFSSVDKVSKSDSLSNFLDTLSQKFKDFGKLGTIISKVLGILSKLSAKLGPIVSKIASKLGDIVNDVLDAITKGLEHLDVNKVLDLLNKGLLGGILIGIKGFVDDSKKLVGTGLFAGILLSIKTFIDEGGSVFTGVKGILDGVKDSLKSYQKSLKAETLLKIAGAMALLAASILVLSLIDSEKLLSATAAMGAMFVGLMTTLNVFEKTTGDGRKLLAMTGAVIGISGALFVLSGAIFLLGKLDPKEASQGVLAIGLVLGLLVLFQKFSAGSKGIVGATAGIFALSLSMLALGVAIRSLGGMDINTLLQGLLAMGAALGIISVGLNSMSTTFAGSASLLLASAAILVLAGALKALGSLSLEQLGIALLGIAGVLTVLGVGASLLTPVAPIIAVIALSLLAIGAAAGAFGLGIAAIGVGLGSLAVGIVTLASLSSAGIAAVTLVITGIAALIPLLAVQAVKGITAFVVEMSKGATKIGQSLAKIGLEMLKGFGTVLPEVIDIVLTFVQTILTKLEEKIPDIVKTGGKLLIGFLKGIRDNIGEVVPVSIEIVTNFINAVASKLPELAQSAWNFIISWIDALSGAAEENIPRLMDSFRELGLSIIKGIVTGWIDGAIDLRNGIIELGRTIIDGFKRALGIESPSTVFIELALQIVKGIVLGIQNGTSLVINGIIELGSKMIDGLKGKYDSMVSAGKDLVLGFAQGIKDFAIEAVQAAKDLASQVLSSVSEVFDSNSPSRKMIEQGKFVDQGLSVGIDKFSKVVVKSVETLGEETVSGFSGVMSNLSNALSSDIDVNPTIRPVIDLSDIEHGGTKIDELLSNKSLNLSLAAIKAASIKTSNQQLESSSVQQKATTPAISFTQINQSPKALSRLDIYRQTKNQLSKAKEMVGVS